MCIFASFFLYLTCGFYFRIDWSFLCIKCVFMNKQQEKRASSFLSTWKPSQKTTKVTHEKPRNFHFQLQPGLPKSHFVSFRVHSFQNTGRSQRQCAPLSLCTSRLWSMFNDPSSSFDVWKRYNLSPRELS